MAEKSSFFTSLNGDRKYKASDFAQYFNSFISDGVFPNPNTNLQVISNGDMTITVKEGSAWIQGYYYNNTSDLTLTVPFADGVLNRIDRVVIRLDYINREIKAYIKEGGTSSNPVPPTLQRDSSLYELCIAEINVNNGVLAINQSNINDTRLKSEVCGMVNSLIKVDSSILTDKLEQDFYDWLDGMKEVLDGDIATKLTLKVQELEHLVSEHDIALNDLKSTANQNSAKIELMMTKLDYVKLNWIGTQEEYDALQIKDSNTLYFIKK